MFVVRPVEEKDLGDLYKMSRLTLAGMTTLPQDKEVLHERVLESLHNFSSHLDKPKGGPYLFVLEDTSNPRVIGTCGIISKVGGFDPFYTYEIKTVLKKSRQLKVKNKIQYLKLLRTHNGPSELGSLFLLPQLHRQGLGRLLSLSRFLFIAQYRKRFEKRIVAEMRGYFDKRGKSPFWESVSRYFFSVDFKIIDLILMRDKSFIEELIPEHPLYIPLLPYSAQKVIGKVYPNTEPALRLLEKEGFKRTNEISIFNAGPVVSARITNIRTFKKSRTAQVADVIERVKSKRLYLIANVQAINRFRVTLGKIRKLKNGRVQLTREAATALKVDRNSPVRFVPLR